MNLRMEIRIGLLVIGLLLLSNEISGQRLDVKGVRKRSKASDVATIVFKSDFDSLSVTCISHDSIAKRVCNNENIWTQYVDLRYEREQGDTMINRRFLLHTPYTEDREFLVPGEGRELKQSVYEYKVRIFDYFPMRVAMETDIVRLKDYFGFRVSVGKRLGGYLSVKLGDNKKGFNADERGEDIDVSKKTFVGKIRNSYLAGIKYGIISRDYPVYLYLGAGYGDDGSQRSNGKKKGKGRIEYYDNYTNGFESEIGANLILFDFLSISMGADVVFGHRVAFDINCTIGVAIDLTQ